MQIKSLSKGVSYGYLYILKRNIFVNNEYNLDDVLTEVIKEINNYLNSNELTDEEKDVMEAHKSIVEDPEFTSGIQELIKNGKSISAAILENGTKRAMVFMNMEDKNLKHIAEDIMDITYQMIDILKESKNTIKIKEPVILYSDTIYPSELLRFSGQYNIAGLITSDTNELSHTALIATSMNIPFITGVNLDIKDKTPVLIDANECKYELNPSFESMMRADRDSKTENHGISQIYPDVRVNAGSLKEMDIINEYAFDIGLFRSEYFYMSQVRMPDDDKTSLFLDSIFNNFKGNTFDYRLPDFGRDKTVQYLDTIDEIGGIKYLIKEKNILSQQLKCLKKHSDCKYLRILVPIVKESSDVIEIKESLGLPTGCMIETVLDDNTLESIIRYSDFISIGSNDLLSNIRKTGRIKSNEINERDIAFLYEYILKIVSISHKENKKVCICGDLATHRQEREKMMKIGLDSISVPLIHIFNK